MTIVEWINQILIYKTPWENFDESEHKTFSTFIVFAQTNLTVT